MDLTIDQLLSLVVLIACLVGWYGGLWVWKRRRSRPRPIEELRASIQERRESLRRASTDYGNRRKREPWNP